MRHGADDERARAAMLRDFTVGNHSMNLAECNTQDEVERYVIKCGHDIGYAPGIILDAAWQAAIYLTNLGKPAQHIINGVYGEHG